MNPRPKLVFFVFPISFFLSHRLPIALRAIEKGYEVHVLSTIGEGQDILEKYGITFHPIQITQSKANPIQELKTILQVLRIYKNIKPDITHNITIKCVLYGTLAARLAKVNAVVNAFSGLGTVFIAKGLKSFIRRQIIILSYKVILRKNNLRTIVQNPDDLRYLIEKSIVKESQVTLIKGSGVDLTKFVPIEEPTGIPVIILPCRLIKDKGVVEFVEAAKTLKSRNIIVRMVLVGLIAPGNPSSLTNKEINKWANEGIIEYWGFSKDMAKTITKSNIICLPSYREGLPKSLIEASASGRAIITTDVPGCREMIDPINTNGILIPSKDSDAIALAIRELIADPDKRNTMALNGRKMAEKNFSIEFVVSKTLELYKQLLES